MTNTTRRDLLKGGVALAGLGMLGYLWFRFENHFALAAILILAAILRGWGMTFDGLRPFDEELTGKDAQNVLDRAGITLNKNTIPDDPRSPFVTSGLRLGTPAVTTQGMTETEMAQIAGFLARALRAREDDDELIASRVRLPPLPVRLRLVKRHQATRILVRAELGQIPVVVVSKIEDRQRPRRSAEVNGIFQQLQCLHATDVSARRAFGLNKCQEK